MNRRAIWLMAVVLCVLFLLVPPGVRGQAGELPLYGEFAVTITAEDVPPTLIDGPMLVGLWQIGFAPDGSYARGRQDVGTLASGRYAIDGDRLTLAEETGLLACGVDDESERDAVYGWEMDGQRLRLTPIEEPCPSRRLLLSSRSLAAFVACPDLLSRPAATPAGTPAAGSATPVPNVPPPHAAIDALLAQLSSCWATREPERFVSLLSREFRDSLDLEDEADRRRFRLSMAAPVVWDRGEEIVAAGPARVTANVRQTSGDDVDFVNYAFVFEDGAWRWDGVVDAP